MNDSANNVSTAQTPIELPIIDNASEISSLDYAIAQSRLVPDDELERRFSYHAPLPGQPERYQKIRDAAKDLAYLIAAICPNSRERNTALTKLDEVVFFANAAIARNE